MLMQCSNIDCKNVLCYHKDPHELIPLCSHPHCSLINKEAHCEVIGFELQPNANLLHELWLTEAYAEWLYDTDEHFAYYRALSNDLKQENEMLANRNKILDARDATREAIVNRIYERLQDLLDEDHDRSIDEMIDAIKYRLETRVESITAAEYRHLGEQLCETFDVTGESLAEVVQKVHDRYQEVAIKCNSYLVTIDSIRKHVPEYANGFDFENTADAVEFLRTDLNDTRTMLTESKNRLEKVRERLQEILQEDHDRYIDEMLDTVDNLITPRERSSNTAALAFLGQEVMVKSGPVFIGPHIVTDVIFSQDKVRLQIQSNHYELLDVYTLTEFCNYLTKKEDCKCLSQS